ncbi:conserved hypothetical protein [Cellulomonas flavigena DSM 20109]|uniref:Integral membrane protein n=1 Tax=Cellulomonas flavigena (strain ATCC 482 / DSM 20109 / BCRC 11376 / JCM 18109 / NBRC 3775 / NCIMB 8073 / NRS 134) TaxID=446466 RepID=D5UCA1_CELFN|nr:hypothetical protein [Cellulomonas flavigena]ADG74215.1 conserved hypothetical protein [Cellulomonas flavigena DSM 20109]
MRSLLLLLLAVPLVALAALVTVVVTSRAGRTPTDAGPSPEITTSPVAYARARRHAALVGAASWAALVVVAAALPPAVPFGRDQGIALACAPAVAGVVALLVSAVGERTWPRPGAPVRRASLARRTAQDVAPRALTTLVGVWVAVLLSVLAAAALTAGDDGRTLTVRHDAFATSSAGPYPGAPYGAPVAAVVAVLLVATALALHLVARRPAVPDVSTADDGALRRASARRVLAAVQLVLGATLSGVLLVVGNALWNVSSGGYDAGDGWVSTTDGTLRAFGLAVAVAAVGVIVTSLVATGVALARASRESTPAVATPAPA